MIHSAINICAVYIYRVLLGDTYVHNIYLEMLWCVLEVLGKKGLQYFNLSSGGLQCWVWREVSGRGAVEIELVMLESKLVPSMRNGSYQIHFRWMGDLKKMSTCKFTSSDPGSEAASSKKRWHKSLESTLLGQMATGACTGRLWWLWTGHGGGFDKKFIISCPYLEVWQCCFTRSVSLENSHRLCRCPCGNQVTAHGKRLVACCCFWGKLGRLACWAEWCLLNTSNYSIITSVCFMQLKHLNHVSRHGFP